nr:hypothetical protein [Tanacetum cinerariifolium]
VATSSTEAKYVVAASCCGQSTLGCSIPRLVPTGGCTLPAGSYSFILLDWFLLVVVLILLVVTSSCWILLVVVPIPTGSYLFMLMNLFLLVVVLLLLVGHTVGLVPTGSYVVPAAYVWFLLSLKISNTVWLNWDGPHMPLLAPMLVVPVAEDGADAVAAGAAAAHDVLPPSVPPTHSSSSIPGPSSAP